MSAKSAHDWLRTRSPAAPEPLAARMEAAVLATPDRDSGVACHIAEAALDCLRSTLEVDGSRAAAFELLAADALITAACELAAHEGAAQLEALAAAYGPDRLAQLLPSEP